MSTVTHELPRSPEDLADAGKKLRERVPLESHGKWKAPSSGRDPLAILRAADDQRIPQLVPIRYGRMLQSPFTFYRGSAGVMAADLANTSATGIKVQACGDCHLKNFGGFATPERNIIFDINDFDETLPAPWEWDVKRLAASFTLAARDNRFSEADARDAAAACARSYRKGIRNCAKMHPLDLWYSQFGVDEFLAEISAKNIRERIEARVEKATMKRGADVDYPKLTDAVHGEIRIRDVPPLIFHPEETRAVDFEPTVKDILHRYRATLSDDRRVLLDRFAFVDAAIKVVGIGSVGTRCWIALLMSASNEPLFLQLKQANASVMEQFAGKSGYDHHGQRVVAGQRLMQAASDIFLGWVTGPAGDFYVRQLRDAKISPLVEAFDLTTLLAYAKLCGRNLARAHAKAGNAWTIGGYLGKSEEFEEAIGRFAVAYADQTEKDYEGLKDAVKAGDIEVYAEG